KEFDEAPMARSCARCFHTEHREIVITSDDFIRELPGFSRALDEPTADGLNTYFVADAARKSGLTVVLSGLGGDEMFLGYRHHHRIFSHARLMDRYTRVPRAARNAAGAAMAAAGRLARDRWRRFDYVRNRSIQEALYLIVRGFFGAEDVARLAGTTRA